MSFSLCPYLARSGVVPHREFGNMLRDMRNVENDLYRSQRALTKEIGEIVNTENKFLVKIDVHQYRPEDIKVSIVDREVLIEGFHEEKNENGSTTRSFSRKVSIPESVDVPAMRVTLLDDGHLNIEGPKAVTDENKARTLPIYNTKGIALN